MTRKNAAWLKRNRTAVDTWLADGDVPSNWQGTPDEYALEEMPNPEDDVGIFVMLGVVALGFLFAFRRQ